MDSPHRTLAPSLAERMPHTMAFPHALGTGLIVQYGSGDADTDMNAIQADIAAFIDAYERTLSRFREDSTVAAMRTATHGGTFDFPDWSADLFGLYDRLSEATDGAIDPCVGEDLIRLGYDARYSFAVDADATSRLGALHGRATWRNDVERRGATLVTRQPVALDFGACGKGYLVDLIAAMLPDGMPFVINAGGDLLIQSTSPGSDAPVRIALEDPDDPERAIGVAEVSCGAFCASAPSRRHWGEIAGHRLHHLLNAVDGLPVADIAATWTYVPASPASDIPADSPHPTATADGLATALFVADPNTLAERFTFEGAVIRADRTVVASAGFPADFYTDNAVPAGNPTPR